MSLVSKNRTARILFISSFACLLALYAQYASAGQITIAGSPTMKPAVEEGGKEFVKSNPEAKFVVGIGGTAHGFTLTGKGETQIGMVTRLPNDKEKTAYPDLQVRTFAIDATGVVVHSSNPVQKITREQMAQICTGKITNWKELGGNDAQILFICPQISQNFYEVLTTYCKLEGKEDGKTIVFKDKGTTDYSTVVMPTYAATQEALAGIVTKTNGITFTSLGASMALAAKAPIKLLDLDGIASTESNVINGSYPLPRKLMFVTKGEPQGEVKVFLDFMCGEAGKKLLKAHGFFESK